MRLLVPALVLAALFQTQTRPAVQRPTFRSGRDLLTIEAFVREKSGQPAMDLKADDFVVKIDGEERPVLASRVYGADSGRITNAGVTTPRFATADIEHPGRVVVFVLDNESLGSGAEKAAIDTAASMIEGLSPDDAVGVLGLPTGGVSLTRDHAIVESAMRRMIGTRPATTWQYHITWSEAVAYDRHDQTTINTVIERECSAAAATRRAQQEIPQVCPPALVSQAQEMVTVGRGRAENILARLGELLAQLAPMRAPRHIVILSGGLPFDPQMLVRYRELATRAAQAHVSIFVVHLDTPESDASDRGAEWANVFAGRDYETGLATIASTTGGLFYTGAGRAAGAFQRIAMDVNSFYELGVERHDSDLDGKLHKVEISVKRPGLTVRTAPMTAVPPYERTASGTTLDHALMQPTDIADLPLELATFALHGRDAGEIRMIAMGRLGEVTTPLVEWGYVLTEGDKVIASARHTIEDKPGTREWATTVDLRLAPGRYRLRLAVTDESGRAGVLDVPLLAALRTAGDVTLSDAVVGVTGSGRLEPAASIRRGEKALAMVELSSGMSLANVTGTLDIVPAGGATAAAQVPLTLRAKQADASLVLAEAPIDVTTLQPGLYSAAAVLVRDGKPFARVSRVFAVAEGHAVAAVPLAPIDPNDTPASLTPADVPANVNALMARVSRYVADYGGKASLLVCQEEYQQRTAPAPLGTPPGRKLTSEFALVRAPGDTSWTGYRDVVEVDGKAVSDRRGRLEQVLRANRADVNAARQIADESARYNIGGIHRNFNVPTAALFFFTPNELRRFTFDKAAETTIDGVKVWEVEFKETARPALIRTAAGKDVPTHGSIWVVPQTGAVVRTRMYASGFIDASTTGEIDVWFRNDARLGLWVPSSMKERYRGRVSMEGVRGTTGASRAVADVETTGTATYSDYKRFETDATIK